ncbi:hypothetical protein AC1031_018080 [Aphanomyces cochlioides]|nr:hypothetical protein AC1031_018080 [Aphanomyces cochlioides]
MPVHTRELVVLMEDGLADENVLPPQPVEVANDVLSNKKSKKVIEKTPKTVWTTEMVATLLDKRCDDYGASFELHRSAAQLSMLWGKVALAINTLHGTSVPASAVKNKYSSLKREYSSIRLAEKATGNDVVCSILHLGNTLLLRAALDDDENDDYSELAPTNDASTKRQAIVSAELERQRAKRVKKLDIGQSLVALGQSLAESMKDMHRIPSETRERENSKLLDAINKLQATVDQSASIQNELLNFLRNSNNSI